jgi:hypothetical protein
MTVLNIMPLKQNTTACCIAVLIMALIGMIVLQWFGNRMSGKIAIYRKAVELNTDEEFAYGLKTSVGYVFAYGRILALDPVTVSWAHGSYLQCLRVTEKYTRHERTVEKTDYDYNGHPITRHETETYYSWDAIHSENVHANRISFCGVPFSYSAIQMPSPLYYRMESGGPSIRYQEYILPMKLEGTLFAELSDGTIPTGSSFQVGVHPDAAKEAKIHGEKQRLLAFLGIWIVTTIVLARCALFGGM